MIRTVFILFLFVPYAVSDTSKCARYTFEQNFNEWLTYGHRHDFCYDMPFWIENQYSNIDISAKNDQSTTFSMPGSKHDVSCMSSFMFTMQQGGTIEVNIYKDDPLNFIEVTAVTSDKIFLGIHHSYQNSVIGWDTLKITLTRNGTYDGFILIDGRAHPNSKILVDSFRYIPPGTAESDCQLYEDETTTPEPTTPEPTTPEPTAPELTTPEPAAPDTTTPGPTTSRPNSLLFKLKIKLKLPLP